MAMKLIQSMTVLTVAVIILASSLTLTAEAIQAGGGARKEGNPSDRSDVSGALYSGTLGAQAIVLEITQGKDTFEGRYFYKRIGKAILLKGTRLPDGDFRVREYAGKKPSGAEWKLSTSKGEASGYFCKCDVRTPAAAGAKPPLSITMGRAAAGVTYNDLLLDYPLKSDPEVRVSEDVGWAMQTDTRFKVSMPTLTRFPDKKVMEKVNADLAAKMKAGRLASAEQFQITDAEGEDAPSSDFTQSVFVGLVSREILSMTIDQYRSEAGMLHPEQTTEVFNYDLFTGDAFNFDGFFLAPEKIAADNKSGDGPATVEEALARLYLKHWGKSLEQCDEGTKNEVMQATPMMYFGKEGLSVEYELSYATRACGEPVAIPYSELIPLVRKDSRLRYLVERQ
jgi:hypothetical protein